MHKSTIIEEYCKRETMEGVNEFPDKYEPSKTVLILALITITTCNIGNYFRADTYQLLDENFRIKFRVGTKEVIQLYTIYYIFSFPFTLFGGIIIAKFGSVNTLNIIKFIIFLSALAGLYASIKSEFRLVQVAMGLEGFASEVNDMAINIVIAIWFKGKFLGFASGLAQFFNSLAESCGDLFTFKLMQKWRDIDFIFVFCCALCFVDCLLTVIFQIFQIKRENYNRGVQDDEEASEKVSFKMFKQLNNKQIWGMISVIFISDNIYYNLVTFTNAMLTKRYEFDSVQASNYMAILPISAMIAAPLFGGLTVKIGRKMILTGSAYIVVILAFVWMYFLPNKGDYRVGICLAAVGAFKGLTMPLNWSGLALVVPESSIPLAFGFTQFSSDIIVAICSYVFGEIAEEEKKENFQLLIFIMILFCGFGLLTVVYTFIQDRRRGGILSLPENGELALGIKKIIDFRGNKREDILTFLAFAKNKEGQYEEEEDDG